VFPIPGDATIPCSGYRIAGVYQEDVAGIARVYIEDLQDSSGITIAFDGVVGDDP